MDQEVDSSEAFPRGLDGCRRAALIRDVGDQRKSPYPRTTGNFGQERLVASGDSHSDTETGEPF